MLEIERFSLELKYSISILKCNEQIFSVTRRLLFYKISYIRTHFSKINEYCKLTTCHGCYLIKCIKFPEAEIVRKDFIVDICYIIFQ